MKRILFTLVLLVFGSRLFAQDRVPENIRNEVVTLIRHANIDFFERRGEIVLDNEQQVLYKATVPYCYLLTDSQYINVLKKNKQGFFSAVYYGGNGIDLATRAFTEFDDDSYDKTIYKCNRQIQKNADGYLTDTIFYKTVPVAVLNISPTDNSAVITIGIFNSKNLSAEKAILPPMIEQPYPAGSPFDHMSVKGNIITVHDWGKDFDGDYDLSVLAKDSCVSGNCDAGKGRKVLASIVNGQPRIRIMQGKFKHSTFLGSGFMLIDGEGPAYDGIYEIQSYGYSYTNNHIGAKAIFHTKVGNEVFKGEFNGYFDYGIGSAFPQYQKFVVCKFLPLDGNSATSPYLRDAYYPQMELEIDIEHASARYRKEEAKLEAERAEARQRSANLTAYNEEHDKCTCCGGKGTITQHDMVHFQVSGNNYMQYYTVVCTCCGGTGLKKDQKVDKVTNRGTYVIK